MHVQSKMPVSLIYSHKKKSSFIDHLKNINLLNTLRIGNQFAAAEP